MRLNVEEGKANNVDPDQTAPKNSLILVCTVVFAEAWLSQYLEFSWYMSNAQLIERSNKKDNRKQPIYT